MFGAKRQADEPQVLPLPHHPPFPPRPQQQRRLVDEALERVATQILPAREPSPPPAPLSDEARKLISTSEVAGAQNVCDSLRALAVARIASHDEWATQRREELMREGKSIDEWCKNYMEQVIAEQEERARRTVRDREIFETNVTMLEKHGMPLPPPRPAQTQGDASGETSSNTGDRSIHPEDGDRDRTTEAGA